MQVFIIFVLLLFASCRESSAATLSIVSHNGLVLKIPKAVDIRNFIIHIFTNNYCPYAIITNDFIIKTNY